jgi:anti-sigma regulatory factor (Ser/Thr protein kinase)
MTTATLTAGTTHTVRFECVPANVGAARRYTMDLLAGHVRADEIAVLVSELATNAVTHTGQPDAGFDVTVTTGLHRVIVTVADGGGGTVPTVRAEATDGGTHGRGMAMVEALADDWGMTCHGRGGTEVWFAFNHAPALAVAC